MTRNNKWIINDINMFFLLKFYSFRLLKFLLLIITMCIHHYIY